MRVFYLNTKKIKRNFLFGTLIVLISAIFTTAMIYQPESAATNKKSLYPIYRVQTDQKVAALTFDISWGTQVPGPVMDILKKYNIKSTFFLSGPWVKDHPEFPKRLAAEGHEIASHGQEHVDLNKRSVDEIKQNIMSAHANIKEVTGVEANLIRVPNGADNETVVATAESLGYKVIRWKTDSLDWKKQMSPDDIVNRVLTRVVPGDIILMHASDTCDRTPEALPRVIEGLQAKGYKLVPVSELLKLGPGALD